MTKPPQSQISTTCNGSVNYKIISVSAIFKKPTGADFKITAIHSMKVYVLEFTSLLQQSLQ